MVLIVLVPMFWCSWWSSWCNANGAIVVVPLVVWRHRGSSCGSNLGSNQQPADLTTRDYKGHQLTDQTSLQSLQSSIQEYIIHGKMICCPDLLLIVVVLDDKSRFCYNSNETVNSLWSFYFY